MNFFSVFRRHIGARSWKKLFNIKKFTTYRTLYCVEGNFSTTWRLLWQTRCWRKAKRNGNFHKSLNISFAIFSLYRRKNHHKLALLIFLQGCLVCLIILSFLYFYIHREQDRGRSLAQHETTKANKFNSAGCSVLLHYIHFVDAFLCQHS